MELAQRGTDNPDQRIQEDLSNFTEQTLRLGLDAPVHHVEVMGGLVHQETARVLFPTVPAPEIVGADCLAVSVETTASAKIAR